MPPEYTLADARMLGPGEAGGEPQVCHDPRRRLPFLFLFLLLWVALSTFSAVIGNRCASAQARAEVSAGEPSGPADEPPERVGQPLGPAGEPPRPADEAPGEGSEPPPAGDVPTEAGAGPLRIVINIPAFRLSLFSGGRLMKDYPIAVGKSVSPSRTGTCTIVRKIKNPTWYPPDGGPPVPPGPDNPIASRWIGLSWPGYGIHGTNNPSSIGHAVTLGCIRMRDEDVRELYDIVPIDTPVEFVYRTIEVSQAADPLGVRLMVYRDIYGIGTNSVAALRSALAAAVEQPMPEVDELALGVIASSQTGRPEPVPWRPRVEFEGSVLQDAARIAGDEMLVALRPVAEALGLRVDWDASRAVARVSGRDVKGLTISGRLYVPVDELPLALPEATFDWDPRRLVLAACARPPAWPAGQPAEPEPRPEPEPATEPEPGTELEVAPGMGPLSQEPTGLAPEAESTNLPAPGTPDGSDTPDETDAAGGA